MTARIYDFIKIKKQKEKNALAKTRPDFLNNKVKHDYNPFPINRHCRIK